MHRTALRCVITAVLLLPPAGLHAQDGITRPAADTTKRGASAPTTPPSSNPAHVSAAPAAQAARIAGTIQIDGRLDEAIWQTVPVISNLHQFRPAEGASPTYKTEVRIAYDDEALYVGARMYDDKPSEIVGRLARRDADNGSDYILVQFDPYHNHSGDASFMLNPAGTRWDGGNGDVSWDPVWEGRTQVDTKGWTAEMRIPFSQLRFRPGSSEPWGF